MSKTQGFTAHPLNDMPGVTKRITVEGESYGPFIIHKKSEYDSIADPPWTVTHKQTGYVVIRSRTLSRAKTAAKAIQRIGVSWDFDDPNAVRKWPKELRKKIVALSDSLAAKDESP